MAFVYALDDKLANPHLSFPSIHVGGTNGKGSVSWKIAKSLEAEGFRVGLYTSPHIWDVRERIQINGEMISKDDLQELLEPLFSNNLSFFDLVTAAAFLYFKKKQVDWAVIEVGLGGRYDATNVIKPRIACITSIGYDHMDILGHTLEEIAWEKGGIVKEGIPLVTGPSAAPFFPGSIATLSVPFFDLENQAIARAVLKELSIPENQGINERPPYRFQVRGNCVYDVAHNPDGFKKLVEALQMHFPDEKFSFIVAFSKDKDWKQCLDLIVPIAHSITTIPIEKERLERPEVLQEYLPSMITRYSIESAIQPNMLNVVCGTFYLMDLSTPN